MKVLVNYANDKYKQSQRFNTWTGRHIAKFDKVFSFGPDDIEPEYYNAHRDILDEQRGNGLWLWKPYFIDKVLRQCAEGDYVFYVDSGAFFVRNAETIIKSFRQGESIWVSDNPTLESCFTKPECFEALDCNEDIYKNSNQIQATYVFFRCCQESRDFIKEWLSLCENKELMEPASGLILDKPVGNGFVAHREDQSMLSLLCKKKSIKPHRDPSQRGKYPETFYTSAYTYRVPEHDDTYKTFISLHKSKSVNPIVILRQLVGIIRSVRGYRKAQRIDGRS